MLNVSIGVGAAEGASLLRRGTSWSGRPPKIILGRIGVSLGQPAHCAQGAILSPHRPPDYSPIFDYAYILAALFIATIAFHTHFIADVIDLFFIIVTGH